MISEAQRRNVEQIKNQDWFNFGNKPRNYYQPPEDKQHQAFCRRQAEEHQERRKNAEWSDLGW